MPWRRRYIRPYIRRYIRGFWLGSSAMGAAIFTFIPLGICGQWLPPENEAFANVDDVMKTTAALTVIFLYIFFALPLVFDALFRWLRRFNYRMWVGPSLTKLRRYGEDN